LNNAKQNSGSMKQKGVTAILLTCCLMCHGKIDGKERIPIYKETVNFTWYSHEDFTLC